MASLFMGPSRNIELLLILSNMLIQTLVCQYVGDVAAGQYAGVVGGPGQYYNQGYHPAGNNGANPSGIVTVGKQPYVDTTKVQPAYFVPLQQSVYAPPVTGFNNTATCTFDQKCFQYSEGCTFINCRPFNRSSPVSCEECLNLCLSKQNTIGPYCCKSVVYDVQYRICDLFSQDIGGNLANLAKRPGHIYFQPTGLCQAVTPAPAAICPSGQVEKLVAIKDYQLPGVTGQTVSAADANACARQCLSNKLGDGSTFACKSAQFANGQCIVSTAQTTAEGNVQKAPGSTYFQKLCFPAALVTGCADIFEEYPQMILVGQSRQVTEASSVTECLQGCLGAQAKFGFACTSAVYFAGVPTQNCILNSESKNTRPDLFTSTDQDKTFYLETGCGTGGTSTGPGSGTGGTLRFRDQSFQSKYNLDQWTNWSPCVTSVQMQFRYRHCSQQDPNKCEKQPRPCEQTSSGLLWGRTPNSTPDLASKKVVGGETVWGRTKRDTKISAYEKFRSAIRKNDPVVNA